MVISTSLQTLLSGEDVAGSKLSGRLTMELLKEGLLQVIRHGSKKSYRARDVAALKRYLIDKDERYRIMDVNASDTRASMASETGNSKLVMVRSCPGFPVNSYEPIDCRLSDKPFVVFPPKGSFVFITDWERFSIPEDVTVIGIENMENFRKIRQQRTFLEHYLLKHELPLKALFVSRYPQSSDLRKWLCTIPNHYLHFGDFDLAGINIFLTAFYKYLGPSRSSFLIPDDIADRLKVGSAKRYDDQLKELSTDNKELQSLIELIRHERKGYDQEGYIEY